MADNESYIDELTKLHNNRYFKIAYQDYIAQFPQAKMLFIDFKRLTYINNYLGHAAGDVCLIHFGKMIRETFPNSLTIRRGGDEFLVITNMSDEEIASKLDHCAQITSGLHANGELPYPYRFNCGIVPATSDVSDTISKADRMMYSAKKNKLNYMFFDAEINEYYEREEGFLSRIDEAIKKHEIQFTGRIIHDLNGEHTNIIDVSARGREDLSQYEHQIMGVLKKHHRLQVIDKEIIEQFMMHRPPAFESSKIMLNLYSQSLTNPDAEFMSLTRKLISDRLCFPEQYILCLNIDSVVDVIEDLDENIDIIIDKLTFIHDLGFKLALSNYDPEGTSPIGKIWAKVPIDYIKIPDSCWKKAITSPRSASLLSGALAGFIAEGTAPIFMRVTKEEELNFLNSLFSSCLCIGDALSSEVNALMKTTDKSLAPSYTLIPRREETND